MKMKWNTLGLFVLLSFIAAEPATQPADTDSDHSKETPVPAVLNFTMKSLNGKDVPLKNYEGKVVLIVNTASKCGLTPQYKALEALHEKYADQGLSILGFPANEFNGQEPGTDEEIGAFCQKNYGVKFDMFSKIVVKGDEINPLYQLLTTYNGNGIEPGDIHWNFEKFLINRKGEIVKRFAPQTTPDSPDVVKAIEAELAAK